MDRQIECAEFQLYNTLGTEVCKLKNISDGTIIDGSILPAGVYLFKIISDNMILQKGKVIKL